MRLDSGLIDDLRTGKTVWGTSRQKMERRICLLTACRKSFVIVYGANYHAKHYHDITNEEIIAVSRETNRQPVQGFRLLEYSRQLKQRY